MLRGRGAAQGAHEDPGVPRRPARHRDHRRGRGAERAATSPARRSTRSRSSPRAPARRRSPASTCWSRSARGARTSGSPTSKASSTRAAPTLMDRWKAVYAQKTDKRTLGRGDRRRRHLPRPVGAAACSSPRWSSAWRTKPLIMALANPTPEIMPEEALAARPDAMICTGRSDYPNQVNNVLCFPYIFRGALDVGATTINEEMKRRGGRGDRGAGARGAVGCRRARLWRRGAHLRRRLADPQSVRSAADPAHRAGGRARPRWSPASRRGRSPTSPPISERLNRFVFRSGFIMKPVFAQAKAAPKRVIYAEGEDERMLRAAQVVVEEGLARPILIGRPAVVERAARALRAFDPAGPRLRAGQSGGRSALPRLCADLYRGRRPQRRHAGRGAHHRAHQRHRDRGARACGAARPTR